VSEFRLPVLDFAATKKWRSMMKKTWPHSQLLQTVEIGAVRPTPADADGIVLPCWPRYRRPGGGAILGAALAAPRPYYSVAYEPVLFGPRCYVRRERFWDGWGWRVRRIEDCY